MNHEGMAFRSDSRHIPFGVRFDSERNLRLTHEYHSDKREDHYRSHLANICRLKDNNILSFGSSSTVVSPQVKFANRPKVSKGFKILDAPGLLTQTGQQVIAWSSSGLIIGLGDAIYMHDVISGETSRVLFGNRVKRLAWVGGTRFVTIVEQSVEADCILLADSIDGHLRNIALPVPSTCMDVWEKIVAIGCSNKMVLFHDLRSKNSLAARLSLDTVPTSVALKDFKGAIGDAHGNIFLFDLRTMNLLSTTTIGGHQISSIVWKGPRDIVVASSGNFLMHITFEFCGNAVSRSTAMRLETISPTTCLCLSSGSLFSGHANGVVSQRKADDSSLLHSFGDDSVGSNAVICIAHDPVSGVVAAAHCNETIRFYRPEPPKSESNDQHVVIGLR